MLGLLPTDTPTISQVAEPPSTKYAVSFTVPVFAPALIWSEVTMRKLVARWQRHRGADDAGDAGAARQSHPALEILRDRGISQIEGLRALRHDDEHWRAAGPSVGGEHRALEQGIARGQVRGEIRVLAGEVALLGPVRDRRRVELDEVLRHRALTP